jgi:hypothetical protein
MKKVEILLEVKSEVFSPNKIIIKFTQRAQV